MFVYHIFVSAIWALQNHPVGWFRGWSHSTCGLPEGNLWGRGANWRRCWAFHAAQLKSKKRWCWAQNSEAMKSATFLVGADWNHGIRHGFPIILGRIIPTDELIFFRGVGIPPTSCGLGKQWVWETIDYTPSKKTPCGVSSILQGLQAFHLDAHRASCVSWAMD